jgi:diguanylate cyclase (GGDEF)-like protein/PAS domain S-box-containing protein
LALYLAWVVALTTIYYVEPAWGVTIWALIGVTGAVAVGTGVRRNRPRHARPWLMIAGSMLSYAVADTVAEVMNPAAGGNQGHTPLVVDITYLVTGVLLITGLIGLVRAANMGRDRTSLLDALTLTAAVGLVSWIYLISPRIVTADVTFVGVVTAVAYPLGDVLILALAVRLAAAARRTPATMLILAGAAALFAGDMLYLLTKLAGNWQLGGWVDVFWIAVYAAFGAASLHPAMVEITEPRMVRPGELLPTRRLVLLMVSSLVAPGILLAESVNGPVHSGTVISLASAALFLLVFTRLLDAIRAHRQAVARERGLREAGAALVAATDVAQVTAVVREAVAHLLPPGTDHRMMLAVRRRDDPHSLGVLPPTPELRYTPTLPRAQAEQLAGFEVTLRCSLPLADRPSGAPDIGVLLIAASKRVLVTLPGAVEVLASQAALALERIELNDEINRRDSEAYFRTLVQNTADVILIVDDDDLVRYASPSATGVFGHPMVPGTALLDLVDPTARAAAGELLDQVRSGEHDSPGADWTVLGPRGRRLEVEVSSRDLRHDRTVRGLVITLRDVTERRQLERELTHLAFHDALTGLANRALFTDRVGQAVERTRTSGQVAGVLVIDLDDFKVVNDTLGHPAGDELLVAVAARLTGVLRPMDTAGRLGGDEFAALIEDASHPAAIERVAERVSAALSDPFPLGDHLINGVASIGVATTRDANDADELLRQADLALYVAKGAGKGHWRRYQPALHTVIVERLQMRAELDRAVATRAFSLRYQPVVGLADGETVGFEALVRWEHPTRGTLLPGEFIGVAEETGLIVPIGNQVLAEALAAAAEWHSRAPDGLAPYVSVNVSARQFRTPGFIEEVRRQLSTSGLPPDRLLLEITESLLLREDEQIWVDLAQLRQLGVRVAIDDFGTGYSSLSYLRQVPLDVVKIDRSFIDTVASSTQQRALVKGIVALANTLGLEVIAEGIQTPSERNILVGAGCPYGQGHLFSKPLEHRAALRWLASDRVAAA